MYFLQGCCWMLFAIFALVWWEWSMVFMHMCVQSSGFGINVVLASLKKLGVFLFFFVYDLEHFK